MYLKYFQMTRHKHKDIRFLKSQTFKELELKDNWLESAIMQENYCGEVNDI